MRYKSRVIVLFCAWFGFMFLYWSYSENKRNKDTKDKVSFQHILFKIVLLLHCAKCRNYTILSGVSSCAVVAMKFCLIYYKDHCFQCGMYLLSRHADKILNMQFVIINAI